MALFDPIDHDSATRALNEQTKLTLQGALQGQNQNAKFALQNALDRVSGGEKSSLQQLKDASALRRAFIGQGVVAGPNANADLAERSRVQDAQRAGAAISGAVSGGVRTTVPSGTLQDLTKAFGSGFDLPGVAMEKAKAKIGAKESIKGVEQTPGGLKSVTRERTAEERGPAGSGTDIGATAAAQTGSAETARLRAAHENGIKAGTIPAGSKFLGPVSGRPGKWSVMLPDGTTTTASIRGAK